jgi:hypothetical protein
VALKYPLAGLGICICCLIVYLKPDPPGAGEHTFEGQKRTLRGHSVKAAFTFPKRRALSVSGDEGRERHGMRRTMRFGDGTMEAIRPYSF